MNVLSNTITIKLFWYSGIDAKESPEDMNQSIQSPDDTNASITNFMNTLNTLSPTIKKGLYSMETTESPVSNPVSNDDLRSFDESIEISSSQGKNIFNISTYRILFFISYLSLMIVYLVGDLYFLF